MRSKNFYDAHQAHRYLNDSVIRLEKEPIYIVAIDTTNTKHDYKLHYIPLPIGRDGAQQKDVKIVRLKDKGINLNPVPLGFINAPSLHHQDIYVTMYSYRVPRRNWHIGLTQNNLAIIPLPDEIVHEIGRVTDQRLIQSQHIKDTIMGVYPSVNDALRAMRNDKNIRGMAFSRNFAINYRRELFFKWNTQSVGTIKDDLSFKLFDDNKYLIQSLTEDLTR